MQVLQLTVIYVQLNAMH